MNKKELEQTLVLIKPDALKNSITGFILSQLSEFHTGARFAAGRRPLADAGDGSREAISASSCRRLRPGDKCAYAVTWFGFGVLAVTGWVGWLTQGQLSGWLLLTHGVGPVRKYSIGAALLDKQQPNKIIARSAEPLVHPDPSEREGYVPNVVYTCGAMRHNDLIILPYAVSDTFSNFATIKISVLLRTMR